MSEASIVNWLNYHHLQYFWHVVREGTISAACEKLGVSQPTISAQLRALEKHFGGKLYESQSRRIVPTELGRTVFSYADEIFSLGAELVDVVNGRTSGGLTKLTVGVPDVLPKLLSYRLLRPVFDRADEFQLVVREGSLKYLLALLATHELDVVFSDTPAGTLVSVKAFNHHLGSSPLAIYGTRKLVRQYGGNLPESLLDAPLFLPREGTTLRRSLDSWLATLPGLPRVVGEFDDTALMKVFAEADLGFISAPTAINAELRARFRLEPLCTIPDATEHCYAITADRKMNHPAIAAISELARQQLFNAPEPGETI